jgi:hypothetical protein
MKEQENTSPSEKWVFNSIRWIFNSLMIWGAVLGFLIGGGYAKIQDTWRHQGSGIVWYEDDAEQVSEKEYKRHHYTMGGFGLVFGLALWITIANGAKKEAAKRSAKEDYLDAKANANAVYQAAFAKVMGAAAYQAIATEAMKDPAYQTAKATEETKRIGCYVASKADKG